MAKKTFNDIWEELNTLYEARSENAGRQIKLVFSDEDRPYGHTPGEEIDLATFKRLVYLAQDVKAPDHHILSLNEKKFLTDFTNVGTIIAESQDGVLAWFPVQRRNPKDTTKLLNFKIKFWVPKKHVEYID